MKYIDRFNNFNSVSDEALIYQTTLHLFTNRNYQVSGFFTKICQTKDHTPKQ
jgi:hypothetical protein